MNMLKLKNDDFFGGKIIERADENGNTIDVIARVDENGKISRGNNKSNHFTLYMGEKLYNRIFDIYYAGTDERINKLFENYLSYHYNMLSDTEYYILQYSKNDLLK